ncbi:MAG: hypothetical protein C4B59_03740 [Candidatus Methanogaster sp.]|uniref:Uncharacterized protein n=1 Tax=Candidatus Methanogaster sp. TaxID=3386292 RepID=A0AC61L530_9EURY|nr:MAG: hypothetical protein C4B59_03740 [ANME-2 cluster archaeon]
MAEMIGQISDELKEHAPFTFFGALTGIAIMLAIVYGGFLPQVASISENIFYVLHPAHVLLSASVTTALYVRYGNKKLWFALLIGYTGSIGIATLSDSIIPHLCEVLLDLPNRGLHIGVIEKPLLTNLAALLGIAIGYRYWKGATEFPHAGHVLLSTWASLFHVITALGATVDLVRIIGILLFLFLAVWIPCCTSDIVYPLLFTEKTEP